MSNLISTTRKRLIPLLGASVLLTGGIGASVLFTGGTADAAACPTAPATQAAGTACDITGTLVLSGGSLTLLAPPALGWATTISGADQLLSDPTAADETYTVNDARGSALGWNVTASSTAFTGGGHTLGTAAAITPTFSTNGSLTLAAGAIAATAPTAACAGTSTCTLPTNVTTPTAYPVTITTGQAATATPVRIYSTDVGSGVGTIVLGGSASGHPVGWWLNVPSNTIAGTYTATVSLELITGP